MFSFANVFVNRNSYNLNCGYENELSIQALLLMITVSGFHRMFSFAQMIV